jgi:hypothetical protein
MSKLFKVGDKVQRINKIEGKTMRGEVVIKGPGLYIDIKLTEGAGIHYAGDIYSGSADFWQLIEEADELPPVPRSVSYLKENGRRKLVARINGDSVNVLLSLSYRGITDAVGYSMEPDAALQLAHDLRRMAMEIKRKDK